MDEACAFFLSFAQAEHASALAFHLEPSAEAASAVCKAAHDLLAPRSTISLQPAWRFGDLSPEQVDAARQQLPAFNYARRELFVVERYAHPEYGEIFVAITSANRGGLSALGYASRIFARRVDGQLKIFALQGRDHRSATGKRKLAWDRADGEKNVASLVRTRPTGIRKFSEPQNDFSSRLHYEQTEALE